MHSERLNEERARRSTLDPDEKAIRLLEASPERSSQTKSRARIPGRIMAEPPTEMARVRRTDVEAESENEEPDEKETDKTTNIAERRNDKISIL